MACDQGAPLIASVLDLIQDSSSSRPLALPRNTLLVALAAAVATKHTAGRQCCEPLLSLVTPSELIYYYDVFISATRDVLNRIHKQGHTLSLEDLEVEDSSDAEDDASAVVFDLVTRYDELHCIAIDANEQLLLD